MSAMWTQKQLHKILSGAGSAAQLLELALAARNESGAKMSYAELARRARFSARSFPREVIRGEKKMSRNAALRFGKALRLPAELTEIITQMAEIESLDPNSQSPSEIARRHNRLQKSRTALIERYSRPPRNDGDKAFAASEHISIVYAALGSLEEGATFAEIERRTSLAPFFVEKTLAQLIDLELARAENGRYFALMNHVAFEKLQAGGGFQRTYLQRLKRLETLGKSQFENPDLLCWEGTLSIRQSDLTELQTELKRVLQDFTVRAEASQGDRVVSILCGMFKPVAG